MIRAQLDGLNITIRGLEEFGVEVQEASYYAVVEALQKAFEASKTMLSETDHTLRELALMGHPYGFTHPQQIHDPDEIIHRQSGAYLGGLRANPPVSVTGTVLEGSITNDDPKDRWLQMGSSKMRSRPWMQWIVDNHGEEFAALIEARINAAIAKFAKEG